MVEVAVQRTSKSKNRPCAVVKLDGCLDRLRERSEILLRLRALR